MSNVAASAASRPTFFVGLNAQGRWVVREARGLIEGVFITRRAAMRFASFEAAYQSGAVIMSPSIVETQIAL